MCANGNHDSEKCWHYAGKLISHGVYWPLWGFLAQSEDFEDDENFKKWLIILCAMKTHGCLEAAGLFEDISREHDSEKDRKVWNTAFELAKEINAEWLEEISHEMDFPFISDDDGSDGPGEKTATSAGASGFPKFYSYNDLDEASQSKDSEINNWATWRLRLVQTSIGFMWHFDVGKDKRIACLKTWLDLTGNILTERYARLGGFCPGVHQDRIGFFYMFTYKRLQDLGYDCNLIPLNEKFRRDLQCQHAFREQCEDLTNTYKEMGGKSYMWSLACYLLGDEKILSDELLAPLQKIVNISFLE